MIYRIKRYASVPNPESPGETISIQQQTQQQMADLDTESKRLQQQQLAIQRQQMITQRQRMRMQEQAKRDRMKQELQMRRMAQEENQQQKKQAADATKTVVKNNVDSGPKNINLYKRGTNPVDPKGMK